MSDDDESEFVRARFSGRRYQDGTLPLTALPELISYERILTELARWCYKQDHPERSRVPKNFTKQLALGLEGIERGSAIARLVRPSEGLPLREQDYFTRARDLLSRAIAGETPAVEELDRVPRNVRNALSKFGRTLEAGDSISLEWGGISHSTYDLVRRRAMQQQLHAEYDESFNEVGLLTGISKGTRKIDFQLYNGTSLSGNLTTATVDADLSFQYVDESRPYVRVVGTSTHYASGALKLLEVEEVEYLGEISPDFEAHFGRIAALEAGWLDGSGAAIAPSAIRNALELTRRLVWVHAFSAPRVYPTPEGGVQAEWTGGRWSTMVEVDPEGDFFAHAVDDADEEHERTAKAVDMNDILKFISSYVEKRGASDGG